MDDLKAILHRLEVEEEDHAQIKKDVADALALARATKKRAEELEARLEPLIDLAPVIGDFAATGRVGRMLGRVAIAIAAFLAALATIVYAFGSGFSGK